MAQREYVPKFQGGGGVSLSSLLAGSAKEWAAKNIAKKDTAQRKKEGNWASIMALLKPAAGFLAKTGVSALGFTNPYLLPLLYGGGTAGVSKLFDVIGRKGFKAGADPSKITATGKYGFGKEAATTLSEGLQESIKERDPLSKESVTADIVGSYVSALTPKLGVDPKTGEMGVEGGELGETIKKDVGKLKNKFLPSMEKATGLTTAELSPFAELMAKDPSKALSSYYQDTMEDIPLPEEADYLSQILKAKAETPPPMLFPSTKEPLSSSLDWRDVDVPQYDEFGSWTGGTQFRGDPSGVARHLGEQSQFTQSLDESPTDWESYYQSLSSPVEEFDPYEMQQGGQVPKYYGGGGVSGSSPTIAGYFGGQGKTLGGSNTQSIGQMLGRR